MNMDLHVDHFRNTTHGALIASQLGEGVDRRLTFQVDIDSTGGYTMAFVVTSHGKEIKRTKYLSAAIQAYNEAS